jgi:hypothetical protein
MGPLLMPEEGVQLMRARGLTSFQQREVIVGATLQNLDLNKVSLRATTTEPIYFVVLIFYRTSGSLMLGSAEQKIHD